MVKSHFPHTPFVPVLNDRKVEEHRKRDTFPTGKLMNGSKSVKHAQRQRHQEKYSIAKQQQ